MWFESVFKMSYGESWPSWYTERQWSLWNKQNHYKLLYLCQGWSWPHDQLTSASGRDWRRCLGGRSSWPHRGRVAAPEVVPLSVSGRLWSSHLHWPLYFVTYRHNRSRCRLKVYISNIWNLWVFQALCISQGVWNTHRCDIMFIEFMQEQKKAGGGLSGRVVWYTNKQTNKHGPCNL